MPRPALEKWFEQRGLPAYRARQVWRWFYQRGVNRYEEMTELPRDARTALAADLPLHCTEIVQVNRARDGSEKRLVRLRDGEAVETVWIPMGSHATVCVSTQVGCPIGCTFCASGAGGFKRNLSPGEIVEQVWHSQAAHTRKGVNNLVFMGIGEPLLNYENLITAIGILNDDFGLCIGSRRMTVSTVGVMKGILALGRDAPQVKLAVSLHATRDELRRRLMPHCPSTLDELITTLKEYYRATRRRVTFEYVLLDGVNDKPDDARELATIAKQAHSKVNLIPYNKVPGAPFEAPPAKHVKEFADALYARHVSVAVRRRKGGDINGACGQLRLREGK